MMNLLIIAQQISPIDLTAAKKSTRTFRDLSRFQDKESPEFRLITCIICNIKLTARVNILRYFISAEPYD